jgi:hypothetical protein
MCRIQNFKSVSFQEIVDELSRPQTRGFTLKFDPDCGCCFRTSTNSKWRINQKLIIAVNDKTNSCSDRMIPHKEVRRIFSEFEIKETLVDDLKEQFPNVAFIAKEPQFETYR